MKLSSNHWLLNSPIAHRGLHSDTITENSLESFQAAIDQSYPVEIDIRLLKDKTPIVFHDEDLKRLIGKNIKIEEIENIKQLKEYPLNNGELIPTLKETIEFINHRTPILIELKSLSNKNDDLNKSVHQIISKYDGNFAIQSFNPYTVRYFLKNTPHIPTGLLSYDFNDSNFDFLIKKYLKYMIDSFFYKPAFIGYDIKTIDNPICRLNKSLRKIPLLAWTIKSKQDLLKVKDLANNYIFDQFEE